MLNKANVWKIAPYILPFLAALGGAVYGSGISHEKVESRLRALEKTQLQCERDHDILISLNATINQVHGVLMRIEPLLPPRQ